jgi:alkylmercury lyase
MNDIERLGGAITGALPGFDGPDQRLALALLRELARGEPVSHARLAKAAGVPEEDVETALGRWPGAFYDDERRVIGFGGLSVYEMSHRFELDGRQLWAWCAWDTLFLPELIGADARVSSNCPVTGEEITLTVAANGVSNLNPPGAVVSFLIPNKPFDANVIQSFCHFVHFFGSREVGEQWTAEHEGTFLISVDDAYELGRRTNRTQFGAALGAPALGQQ